MKHHRWLARGKRISAIAAISCDGVLEYEFIHGNVNGELFLNFIRSSLIPQMTSFDGISDRSIAVLPFTTPLMSLRSSEKQV